MKKLFLLFLAVISITLSASAQTRTVNGTVVDAATDEPLVGVSVTAGTGYGAVTDIDGNFSIRIPAATKEINVSYVGYKAQTVAVTDGKLNIRLHPDTELLDEVIAVAYGTAKRSAFTGSAAVVGSAQIEKTQVTNVLDALSGKVAGLQLSNASGAPGASSPTIRIRGFSSIIAGNSPLVIVDGAPYSGDINNLNTNDIESMSVLKDAASNALYGARGANGVILITTKRAKLGDARVTVDAKWGANTRATQDYNFITDPAQYYETYYRALNNYATGELGYNASQANIWANNNLFDYDTYGLGYNVYTVPDGQMLIGTNGKLNPNATLGRTVNYKGQDYLITPDNWLDEVYRTSLRQEYNVSVTQGTEKSNFYASAGFLKNDGIIISKSDFQRFTGRLAADVQAKSWLKVGANINYTHFSSNSMSGEEGASASTENIFAAATEVAPIYPLYIRDGQGNIMFDQYGNTRFDYGAKDNAGLQRPIFGDSNAISQAILNKDSHEGNAFNGTGFFEIRFLNDFKFTSNNTVDIDETRYTSVTNPYYGGYADLNGVVGKQHSRTFNQTYQQLLNWDHTFGQHNVSVLAGHEYYLAKAYLLSASKYNMFAPSNDELAGAISNGTGEDSYVSEYNNEGWIFRGQYDYDSKYFASASFRRDASSRFHPDHRWGNFWSLGAAWIMSKEDFLADVTWINTLKVKASYGEQGNDNISNYLYTNTYALTNSNGMPSAVPSTYGNEDITWEKGGNFNAGVEFALFDNRLSGSVEAFWRKTSDMLAYFPLPSSYGFMGYYDNVGDMTNTGVEIELQGDIIRTRDFRWSLNANLTWYKNRISMLPDASKQLEAYDLGNGVDDAKLYEGYSSLNYFYGEGLPMYSYYTKKYAGVNPEDGKPLYWKATEKDGTVTWSTTDVYDDATNVVVGSCLAPVYGGFSTDFSYKGFDLSLAFNYQIGGKVYDSNYALLMGAPYGSGNRGMNIHADILDAWTPENTASDIPRFVYGDQTLNSTSSRFLTDASYLSLENINFGYTLPDNIVKKLYLNKLRVYFACDNVWVWSKRQGLDPRQSFTGGNNNTYYAPIRTISGGLTVTF